MNSDNTAQTEGPSAYPRAATLELRDVASTTPAPPRPRSTDLSLTVPAGEICVLVGPSGCGKTTAMRMVNRMIDLTSGDILLDGASVHGAQPGRAAARDRLRDPADRAVPAPDVADNIATVPRLLGWDKERVAARVDELLELVGLDAGACATRYPAQLSGGQRQRVGVARALAADPPLMLMDEPFGAIDPITRERLQDEFLRLQARVRKTVVFVTHDIDEAIKMGDRIAILREGGELAQYATPDEILAAPADDFVARFVGADRGAQAPRAESQAGATLELRPLDAATRGGARRRRRGRRRCATRALAMLAADGETGRAACVDAGRREPSASRSVRRDRCGLARIAERRT